MFDRDSSSMVRSLIGLVAFRSNPVFKVYQHSLCNGGIILEVAWLKGSLRKNRKRHCCWGVNTRSISQIANRTGPNRTRAQWKFNNVYHHRCDGESTKAMRCCFKKYSKDIPSNKYNIFPSFIIDQS